MPRRPRLPAFAPLPLPSLADLWRGLDDFADRALDRSVRLAVTGLSHAGKTVFITSLVHQLLTGARLPFLGAANGGRLIGAKIVPQSDLTVAEFRYRDHIEALTSGAPAWPQPTDRISEMRVAIRFRPAGALRRQLVDMSTLYLDIVDYPGEWLLDLPLLELTFADWSRQTLALCAAEPRASLAKEWLDFLGTIDPTAPADEEVTRRAADLYTAFLHRCKSPEVGLSLLQPGRFTMPGDLEGAPVLVFCPLPPPAGAVPPPGSVHAVMAERFEAYKARVVRRFYREQFARFDRQIVLVDLLKTLNLGGDSFRDMREALSVVLRSFSYGHSGLLARLFRPRIDKVLFAATKADHVASDQHANLRRLLERMVGDAAKEARFSGIDASFMTLASVKATETVVTERDGQPLACVRGVPQGREREVILFPGEVPSTLPAAEEWSADRFSFLAFRPPLYADAAQAGLPHVRLDQALEFLIGDKLS
jgi:uncharacterized protein